MIVKMIKNLENRMEKMQESINKNLEELKNKHTETKNTQLLKLKITIDGTNRRISEAEVDVFLEFSCFFNDPTDVGNQISDSSASSKSSLNIWKFSVHILRKPSLENFEHYLDGTKNECSCVVV